MKTSDVNGYLEWGTIKTNDHKTIGFTPERIKEVIAKLRHPDYLYCRSRYYGITIYVRDNESPTGVIGIGGMPHELEFLVDLFHPNCGPLSPTEDLRTAH